MLSGLLRKLPTISLEGYLQIEESLMQSTEGRAFLREHARRSRMLAQVREGDPSGIKAEQLAAFQAGAEQAPIDKGALKEVVEGVISEAIKGLSDKIKSEPVTDVTQVKVLRQELHEMAAHIQQTRSEISQLRPADAGNNRIMAATNELDAIVTATERATSDILNAAEHIQAQVQSLNSHIEDPILKEFLSAIDAASMDIFTACSFQDITGQRTSKVVNTLRYIEQRVNTMIEIWGVDEKVAQKGDLDDNAKVLASLGDKRPDLHLLNGPSSDGVSQDSIDALFDMPSGQPQSDDQAGATEADQVSEAGWDIGDVPTSTLEDPFEDSPAKVTPVSKAAPAPAPSPTLDPNATASQADIDALFG